MVYNQRPKYDLYPYKDAHPFNLTATDETEFELKRDLNRLADALEDLRVVYTRKSKDSTISTITDIINAEESGNTNRLNSILHENVGEGYRLLKQYVLTCSLHQDEWKPSLGGTNIGLEKDCANIRYAMGAIEEAENNIDLARKNILMVLGASLADERGHPIKPDDLLAKDKKELRNVFDVLHMQGYEHI